MTAEYKVHGDVAVITLNNPPVNGLGYETRLGITNGLARANADAAVKAIVLTGAGKAFSVGGGHPRIRQSEGAAGAQPAERDPGAGAFREAGRGCHPHGLHGRRLGTGAGLPLPHYAARAATWRCPKSNSA
jgi:enoyl-CoA hydratase/carnithine racemase